MSLEAVYPEEENMDEEMSFEELRAKSRGWLRRDWAAENSLRSVQEIRNLAGHERTPNVTSKIEEAPQALRESPLTENAGSGPEMHDSSNEVLENTVAIEAARESKSGRTRKIKIREVKGETQTSMFSLHDVSIKLILRSQDESRISNGTKTQKKEFRRANYDSPYESRH